MQTREKVAFIDWDVHQTTQSFAFLRAAVADSLDVCDLWYPMAERRSRISLRTLNAYRYAVFCQAISPMRILRRTSTMVTWAPMYDGEGFCAGYWRLLAETGTKIIAFSSRIGAWAESFGLDCLRVRYYPNPDTWPEMPGDPRIAFFWDRGDMPFAYLRALLSDINLRCLVYRHDPRFPNRRSEISASDIRQFNIEFVETGFVSRAQYVEMMRPAGIFIASRLKEGIGQAFLEAMAMGKCVVAHDDATMNEYIKHGENGLLFEKGRLAPLKLDDIVTAQAKSRTSIRAGHSRWLEESKRIPDFVRQPSSRRHELNWSGRLRARYDWLRYCTRLFRQMAFSRVYGKLMTLWEQA